ncbi:50S ribosomal protein L7/L12 [Patescibacteria group bacterium]|nr:50S ribosomal protein L7/L12 [Patescibacteria group bacterium]
MVEKKEKEPKKIDPEKSAKADNGVKVPEKFKKLVGEIEKMSILDLAELVKVLEKRFGVSAVQPVVAAPAPATPAVAEVEEKTIFSIFLKEIGDKKIEVIKAVRDITGRGLKDSKDLVDATASGPQLIKENVKKEEAEEMKKRLETAGAKIELK